MVIVVMVVEAVMARVVVVAVAVMMLGGAGRARAGGRAGAGGRRCRRRGGRRSRAGGGGRRLTRRAGRRFLGRPQQLRDLLARIDFAVQLRKLSAHLVQVDEQSLGGIPLLAAREEAAKALVVLHRVLQCQFFIVLFHLE